MQKWAKELIKNCNIALTQYKHVVGILYNGKTVRIFLDNIEAESTAPTLQDKSYYLTLFTKNAIDKQQIYTLTKRINDYMAFKTELFSGILGMPPGTSVDRLAAVDAKTPI